MQKQTKYTPRVNYNTHEVNYYNIFSLDEKLLVDLFSIVSESYHEEEMREFILNFIKNNIPKAVIEYDIYGNLYITKTADKAPNYYPAIVSHMDEVISDCSNRVIVKANNIMMGLNSETGDFAGIGGDDKCGIYICLELLRILDHVKVAFFIAEETGGDGSGVCDLTFFDDCRFILQPDRYGNSSVITDTNGLYVTGVEFEEAITNIMYDYAYCLDAKGTFTDIGVLAKRGVGIAVSNISCGYYNQHTEEEVVCLADLENSLNFIYRIMIDLEDIRFMQPKTSSYYDTKLPVIKPIKTERFLKKPKKFVYLGYTNTSYSEVYSDSSYYHPRTYQDDYDFEYEISNPTSSDIDDEEEFERLVDIAFINKSKLKTLNELSTPTLERYIRDYKTEIVKKFGYSGYTRLFKTVYVNKGGVFTT